MVLKIRRKGILILPKKLREEIGVKEGDDVIAEVVNGKLVINVLKPKIVDVDPDLVEKILGEEYSLEREKYGRLFK